MKLNKWEDVEPFISVYIDGTIGDVVYDAMNESTSIGLFEEISITQDDVYNNIWDPIRNPMLWIVSKNDSLSDKPKWGNIRSEISSIALQITREVDSSPVINHLNMFPYESNFLDRFWVGIGEIYVALSDIKP
jgi:hypothetical protein